MIEIYPVMSITNAIGLYTDWEGMQAVVVGMDGVGTVEVGRPLMSLMLRFVPSLSLAKTPFTLAIISHLKNPCFY